MNDRFKFRVWDIEDCSYICRNDFDDIWFDKEGELHIGMYSDFTQGIEDYTSQVIIEQCTGLKDNCGNLIYENDLIKSPNNSCALVVYYDITGLWRCKENRPNGTWELPLYDLVRNYGVEIIGNIHEQKEQQ